MKLATFIKNENERLAVKLDNQLIDIEETARKNNWEEVITDVMQVIQFQPSKLQDFENKVIEAAANGNVVVIKKRILNGVLVLPVHIKSFASV